MKKILLIDDSALMRNMMSDIIEKESGVCVADTAENGYVAIQLLKEGNRYDLILLDINMPKLNGVGFLEYLNRSEYKIPVLIVSSISSQSTAETLRALELGAYDFVKKPGGPNGRVEFKNQLCEKIQCAFRLNHLLHGSQKQKMQTRSVGNKERSNILSGDARDKLIFIASSTGGPKALQSVIPLIPENIGCPVVVVQHMPEGFTGSLADRLDEMSPCKVVEAADGAVLERDIVYVAKGGNQLRVETVGGKGHRLAVSKEPARNGLRPCADIFLESLMNSGYKRIICAVLTGMGSDATKGLLQLKQVKDVYTVGQSKETCVVYGMPRSVAQAGVVDVVADLTDVADLLVKRVR